MSRAAAITLPAVVRADGGAPGTLGSVRTAVTAEDVETAAAAIAGAVVRTPSLISRTLSAITGAEVVIKFENHQFTGSFKDRGAANRLAALTAAERDRGVVALSAGNHAQGVAHAAGRMGIPATVVMPVGAPFSKVVRTRDLGAEVVQEGETLAAAAAAARRIAEEHDLVSIHPYDDPLVIAGQGTAGRELLEDHPDLEAIVVPAGGGGLLAGVCLAADAAGAEVIGVQSALYAGLADALAGRETAPPGSRTVADGIAVKAPGRLTLPIVRERAAAVVTVAETAIERAVALFAEVEKTVAEGAGAAGLAALLEHDGRFAGRKVGVILSGGNIDSRVLAGILMRGLVEAGRVVHLRVEVEDAPGRLAPLVTRVGELGANLIDLQHGRLFGTSSATRTGIELVLEVRDDAHAEEVAAGLAAAGFDLHDV